MAEDAHCRIAESLIVLSGRKITAGTEALNFGKSAVSNAVNSTIDHACG